LPAGQASLDQCFLVDYAGTSEGRVAWEVQGDHNRLNALAAVAAARHVGVVPAQSAESLARFRNVKRRMEVRGTVDGVTVYDDFAHHPTAIETTIAGLRARLERTAGEAGTAETVANQIRGPGPLGASGRILAVLEPRSNTMKLGVMRAALPGSLEQADLIFGYAADQGRDALGWDLSAALAPLGARARAFDTLPALVDAVAVAARPGDQVLVMSNGGFGGVHQKLLDALAARPKAGA